MKKYIIANKRGATSAKLLADIWGATLIKHKESKYVYDPDHIILNFGNSAFPEHVEAVDFNSGDAVANSVNKLQAIKLVKNHGIKTIECANFKTAAGKKLVSSTFAQGLPIIARTTTEGMDGEGTHFVKNPQEFAALDHAKIKMVSRYIPNTHEFRVHVVCGSAGALCKRVRKAKAEINPIQTTGNGYVLAWVANDNKVPADLQQKLKNYAVEAAEALDLDVVAIDFLVEYKNNQYGDIYFLESNTAFSMGPKIVNEVSFLLNQYLLENYVDAA